MTFDRTFGQACDQSNLTDRQFFQVIQGQDRALQRRQAFDRSMQFALGFGTGKCGNKIEPIADVIEQRQPIVIAGRFGQQNPLTPQTPLGHRRRHLPDPRF